MLIRAKFRCMTLSHFWDQTHRAEFRPVKRSNDKDSENNIYWKATPSGEASLLFRGKDLPTPLELGGFYYIDMEPAENGEWTLFNVTRSQTGGEVQLELPWDNTREGGRMSGTVKMSIDNPPALEGFGFPPSKWKVTFWLAESTDYTVELGNTISRS